MTHLFRAAEIFHLWQGNSMTHFLSTASFLLMYVSACSCVKQSDAFHRWAPLGVFWLPHSSSSPPAGLGSGSAAPPAVAGLRDHPSSGLHSGQPQQHSGRRSNCCSSHICKSSKLVFMQNKSILFVCWFSSLQLMLGVPQQALSVLHEAIEPVLAHGAIMDKGRALLLTARCQMAVAGFRPNGQGQPGNSRSLLLLLSTDLCHTVMWLNSLLLHTAVLSPCRSAFGNFSCWYAEGGCSLFLQTELQGASAGRPLPAGSAPPLSGTNTTVQQECDALPAAGPGAAVTSSTRLHETVTARWSYFGSAPPTA